MNVIKRDGKSVDFDFSKIVNAMDSANQDVGSPMSFEEVEEAALEVREFIETTEYEVSVEQIQDKVEHVLMTYNPYVARAYIRYRYDRERARSGNADLYDRILSIVTGENEEVKQENSNKNPMVIPTSRDYIAGEVSKSLAKMKFIPENVVVSHEKGAIHSHDTDYRISRMNNCCLVNLEDMLQNGTVLNGKRIDTPKMFSTACTIATQIAAQVSSSQFGGQTMTLSHLAPFVESSRSKFREMLKDSLYGKQLEEAVDRFTLDDVKKGCQTIQYQIETISGTNGQAPFITLFMYLDEVPEGQIRDDLALIIKEFLIQRIKGVKNEDGIYVTPAFPKLIYVLDEDNINTDSKYYWLTQLAAECTAKRMVPDYISAKIMKKLKGDVYSSMGCRSFLTPDPDNHKYYGRFNIGVCSVNLSYPAMESGGDESKFWSLLDKYCEDCFDDLMARIKYLSTTPAKVAPILWQYGALARLNSEDTLEPLLHNYCTASLGYAGLYECTKYMTGESHTAGGKGFALRVMKFLNDKCYEWRERYDCLFSLYGTPLENTTAKFAKALKQFPFTPGVNDRMYVTNSYHVPVFEEIDAFTKLSFESEFQELSPGGAISYVEVPDMTDNIPAVLTVMRHIYDNIMYAELNGKFDYCGDCGFEGQCEIVEQDKKMIWRCPKCGCTNQDKLYVTRRTCGYIGTQKWSQGRTAEIRDRVLHL